MATNRDTITSPPGQAGTAAPIPSRDIPEEPDRVRDGTERSPEQIEREIEATRREMSQTIDAIQRRLSPDYLMDQAMGYFRTGPGTFANNLGKAMRDNPVPVALVGIGVTWLALGGGGRVPGYLRRPERTQETTHYAPPMPARERAGDMASSPGSYERDDDRRARESGPGLGQRLSSAGRRAGEIASSASERVRKMASDVRELAEEWSESTSSAASSARESASEYGSSIRNQAQHLGSSLHEQASHMGSVVRERTAQVQNTFSQLMREQPLVVGALGVAIGAMLGALLPATRREDELLGETRDRLLDQATEAGHQALHQASDIAKQSVNAATETIKQEASERGWTQSDDSGSTQAQSGAQSQETTSAAKSPKSTGADRAGSDTLSAANREQGKKR